MKKTKSKSLFKSDKQKKIYVVWLCVMIISFIYLGTIDFNEYVTDGEKFASEFTSLSEDNVYVYAIATEALSVVKSDDAIILFGSSLNSFTEDFAYIINDVAKEYGIDEIIYYDFFDDRTHNNGNYELIVNELSPYLLTDDLGKTELYAPTLVVISDNTVIYVNQEVNFVNGSVSSEDYWSDFNEGSFRQTLENVFTQYKGGE